MKTRNIRGILVSTVAAILLFANRSQAECTNYVADIQFAVGTAYGILTTTYHDLTNNPSPTPLQRHQAGLIKRAIADLSKPAATPADAYKLFFNAAQHLGPLALQSPFADFGSNIFNVFTNEAQAEIDCTTERVGALNSFVRTKKPASNQLAQAQATLNSIHTLTDPRIALLVARQVFVKIVAANKQAAIGEAHPGFAADNVIGLTLEHTERGGMGTVHFDDATQASETDSDGNSTPTYTWTRTGLNTATLVLTNDEGGGLTSTTTVKIRFSSTTTGTFTFRNVDSDNSVNVGSGRFTLN